MREELHKLLPKELLQKEFDSGLWHKEIGEKYKVSWRQIYYLVKDYDLKLPRKNQKKIVPKYKCKRCGKEFIILHNGICHNCLTTLYHINNDVPTNSNNTVIHSKILELRKSGKSYSEIAKIINCTRSTVSYHCNQNTKKNVKNKHKRYKEEQPWKYKLLLAIDTFKRRKRGCGRINF